MLICLDHQNKNFDHVQWDAIDLKATQNRESSCSPFTFI